MTRRRRRAEQRRRPWKLVAGQHERRPGDDDKPRPVAAPTTGARRARAHTGDGWRDRAACIDSDAVFFPERGQSAGPAKAVCRGCPVAADCLEYALVRGEQHGIWGGTSERQRRVLRRERGLSIASEDGDDGG